MLSLERAAEQPTPATSGEAVESGALPWDKLPVYPGSGSEVMESCPPQWEACEICEHRIYATSDVPEEVCSFYESGMSQSGWDKLVYQSYPEGSCMGSWMADMGDSSGPRLLMAIGRDQGDRAAEASRQDKEE